MKSIFKFVFLILASWVATAGHAGNLTPEMMEEFVKQGTCPVDLTPYKDITYTDAGCTKSCETYGFGTPQCGGCQNEVDKKNKKIYKFNEFISECKRKRGY